jgi:hypothetical protein
MRSASPHSQSTMITVRNDTVIEPNVQIIRSIIKTVCPDSVLLKRISRWVNSSFIYEIKNIFFQKCLKSPRSAADMLEIYSPFPMVLKTEHGFTLVYNCFNYVILKKNPFDK